MAGLINVSGVIFFLLHLKKKGLIAGESKMGLYYMATIVPMLRLAAEQALFSCNDRAL